MLTSMLVEIKHMKKKFCDQICAKMDQNQAVFFFFFFGHFLKFGSLFFLYIVLDDTLQQCLTISGGKTHKKIWGPKFGSNRPKLGPKLGFFVVF